jgi:dTDP-4-amino-4,6-dideoxygalactose transaminase
VALACRLLGIGPGHEVLVPAYNCGTELDAVLHSGARIVGYQVSRRCEIEMEDLIARRSSRTRAVYLIHYFGWEQPMEELRRWCQEEGLLLIEDCALALFSQGPVGTIGRTGDAAIFSLPKTLGFFHGGLLSMPASRTVEMPRLAAAGFAALMKEIRHSARAMALGRLERLGLYGNVLSARRRLRGNRQRLGADGGLPQMPGDYYFNPEIHADRALHLQACAVAGSVSCEEIVRRRRGNYLRLAAALDGIKGVRLLYHELPEGVCPLSLPLLVSNRDACVEVLQARGIAAFPWWAGFHRNGLDWSRFPEACWLKHNMLTLPVHQGLDDRHLNYMVETVAEVLRPSPGCA